MSQIGIRSPIQNIRSYGQVTRHCNPMIINQAIYIDIVNGQRIKAAPQTLVALRQVASTNRGKIDDGYYFYTMLCDGRG